MSNASFQDYLEKQTRSKLLKANETADKLRRVQTTLVVDSTVIHSLEIVAIVRCVTLLILVRCKRLCTLLCRNVCDSQATKEDLATSISMNGSLQRSATGCTVDGDVWDAYTQRQVEVHMRRRDHIDDMFNVPNVFLSKEDIDWVSVIFTCTGRMSHCVYGGALMSSCICLKTFHTLTGRGTQSETCLDHKQQRPDQRSRV